MDVSQKEDPDIDIVANDDYGNLLVRSPGRRLAAQLGRLLEQLAPHMLHRQMLSRREGVERPRRDCRLDNVLLRSDRSCYMSYSSSESKRG